MSTARPLRDADASCRCHIGSVDLAVLSKDAGGMTVASSIDGMQTILLVDDDELVRSLLARVLRARGYDVLEAASGEDAQVLVQHHDGPLDLLVCDVLMSGLSGPDLAERLLAARPGLRMLLMSGDPGMASVLEESRLQAAFIGKPFTPQKLVSRVELLLAS